MYLEPGRNHRFDGLDLVTTECFLVIEKTTNSWNRGGRNKLAGTTPVGRSIREGFPSWWPWYPVGRPGPTYRWTRKRIPSSRKMMPGYSLQPVARSISTLWGRVATLRPQTVFSGGSSTIDWAPLVGWSGGD